MKKPTQSKIVWLNSLFLAITAGVATYEAYMPFLQNVLPGDATVWILAFFAVNNIANVVLRFFTTESIR